MTGDEEDSGAKGENLHVDRRQMYRMWMDLRSDCLLLSIPILCLLRAYKVYSFAI